MDAREKLPPAPPVPAAESLPEWMVCVGCRYDLAGLPRGGVCPECGLATPAAWPVWDLRACDLAHVVSVIKGVRLVRQAAMAIALAASCGVVAAVLAIVPIPRIDRAVLVAIAIAVAAVFAVGSGFKMAVLNSALRVHDAMRDAPAAASQRALARDAGLAGWVLLATLVLGVGLLITTFYLGIFVAAIGLPLWLICVGSVCVTGSRFLGDTIERAGGSRSSMAASYAIGLLPFAGLGMLLLAMLSLVPWVWLPIATLLGVALGAGGLARRCALAQRVLRELIAETE